jgi:deazaflavin-dependent oxidoreductase (nitroreductase family)
MRPRPGTLLRLFFGAPPLIYRLLYRLHAAELMRGRMVLLTTRGRRTGRPRTCALNYAIDDGTVYVMSGFGRTDWIRNLEADPHVEVALGQDRWAGDARMVTDPGERSRAMRAARIQAVTQGPPDAVKPLVRLIGLDYDAEIRKLDDPRFQPPTVAITRVRVGAT